MSGRRGAFVRVLLAAVLALVSLGSVTLVQRPVTESSGAAAVSDRVSSSDVVTLPESSRSAESREQSRWSSRLGVLLAVLVAALLISTRPSFGRSRPLLGDAHARRVTRRIGPRAPPIAA